MEPRSAVRNALRKPLVTQTMLSRPLAYGGLHCNPVAKQALKARHIQLGQQQPQGGVRLRLAEPLHTHQRAR
jgi:hypothetical protein